MKPGQTNFKNRLSKSSQFNIYMASIRKLTFHTHVLSFGSIRQCQEF